MKNYGFDPDTLPIEEAMCYYKLLIKLDEYNMDKQKEMTRNIRTSNAR